MLSASLFTSISLAFALLAKRESSKKAAITEQAPLSEQQQFFSAHFPVPAIGSRIENIETPALLLDLNQFEKNLRTMQHIMSKYPNVKLRAHAKAHKCSAIAMLQIQQYGSIGVCCQKLCEAEALVSAGIKDILITNEIVEKTKLERLVQLAKLATISICVDNAAVVHMLDAAAESEFDRSGKAVQIGVLVEVNVGQNRCGVEPGQAVVELAQEVIQLSQNKQQKRPKATVHQFLVFKGIQAYHGGLQHVRSYGERKIGFYLVAQRVKYTLDVLNKHGISCQIVTGGGTGSFELEAASGLYTEVQPGSYIFMDADYARNLNEKGEQFSTFGQSLFVYSCVVSKNTQRVVIDAGMKAVSLDSGVPLVTDKPSLIYKPGGDEHGILMRNDVSEGWEELESLRIAEKIRLTPGHCDPTVNMHNCLIGVRDEKVECVWHIEARNQGL